MLVNPSSCFVNAGECSVCKINLSSLFIKRAATIASARLNGGITLKLFMMSWKPVLTSCCSISTRDYSSTTRGVWPESAWMLHRSWRTPKHLQIKLVHWRCRAQNARRYRDQRCQLWVPSTHVNLSFLECLAALTLQINSSKVWTEDLILQDPFVRLNYWQSVLKVKLANTDKALCGAQSLNLVRMKLTFNSKSAEIVPALLPTGNCLQMKNLL